MTLSTLNHPPSGGGFSLLLVLGALVVGLAVLVSSAYGYTATEYCRDQIRAEKLTCRAEYHATLADCAWSLASDRWFGLPGANQDAVACRLDAAADLLECRAEIFCEVQP